MCDDFGLHLKWDGIRRLQWGSASSYPDMNRIEEELCLVRFRSASYKRI